MLSESAFPLLEGVSALAVASIRCMDIHGEALVIFISPYHPIPSVIYVGNVLVYCLFPTRPAVIWPQSHKCFENGSAWDSVRFSCTLPMMAVAVLTAREEGRLPLFPSPFAHRERSKCWLPGQLQSSPGAGGVPLCSARIVTEILVC